MPPSPDWFLEYFDEPYGEVYAEYLLSPDASKEEAQFVCDALSLPREARILDCPCGYGRHMEILGRLFPNIVGVDLNADCLNRALDLQHEGLYIRGDMRRLPLPDASFDAVLNLFNSFGYFNEAENGEVLREYARVMRPGAAVVIDVANPDPLIELIQERPRTQQQIVDLVFTEDWHYAPETRILHNDSEFCLAGESIWRSYDLRLYTVGELAGALEQAGLEMEHVYGDFDLEEYDPEESTRLIVTGRKPD